MSQARFDALLAEKQALQQRCDELAELHRVQQRVILALEREKDSLAGASTR